MCSVVFYGLKFLDYEKDKGSRWQDAVLPFQLFFSSDQE